MVNVRADLEYTGFGHRCNGLIARFGPDIHIAKVPTVVPKGALYGAIQLASKRFVLHQSATNGHQSRHFWAAKNQTEPPTVLGVPA
jgi:hypothetical protein